MSYGLKYTLRYQVRKTNQDVKVKIYEDGYLGANTFKKIGASRIILSKEKDEKICGTALDFAIQADVDFEYTNFFNSDNKTHRVDLLLNDFIIWSGFIVSDQYSEPYVAPPFDVQVLCTDGLGLLKTEDFGLTGYVSRFTAIRYCLDKIGLNLGYQINIDLWESNMNPALFNMLDQLYFQAEILSEKTCYEVIQALLPEGTTITQHEQRWLIERTCDFFTDPGLTAPDNIIAKPRYYYNSSGVYENLNPTADVYLLGTISDYAPHPVGQLTENFRSAWKNFNIKQIYGKKESFLLNYDFSKGTTAWTETGGTGFFKTVDLEKKPFALISGTQATLTKYISQAVKVKPSDNVLVEINYSPVGFSSALTLPGLAPIYIDIDIEIRLIATTGGAIYYLDNSGWVLSTVKRIKIVQAESSTKVDAIVFKTYQNNCKKFPVEGTLTVKIFQRSTTQTPPPRANYSFYGIAIEHVKIYTQNLALFSDAEETKVILADNATEEGQTIELMPTDLPDIENANLYFDNGNYTGSTIETAVPAELWGPSAVRYIEYLAAFINNQTSIKRATLTGQLTNASPYTPLNLNMFFQHPLNNYKIFTIETGRWNVIDHTIDVTLLEVIPINTSVAVVTPDPFDPVKRYSDHPDLADYTSVGNEGSYTKVIDGLFDHILPGTSNPVIVSIKETITPYHLDPAAGTPQFSITGAMVELNVGGNPNAVTIEAGELFSHNFFALTRPDILIVKDL